MEAIDDFSGSTHYDASLDNMMTTATGFVIEALEKKSIKQATSILIQMVCSTSVLCHDRRPRYKDYSTFSTVPTLVPSIGGKSTFVTS